MKIFRAKKKKKREKVKKHNTLQKNNIVPKTKKIKVDNSTKSLSFT